MFFGDTVVLNGHVGFAQAGGSDSEMLMRCPLFFCEVVGVVSLKHSRHRCSCAVYSSSGGKKRELAHLGKLS